MFADERPGHMPMLKIQIRPARPEDAREILEAHFTAVRSTASRDYGPEITSEWSPEVTSERIQKYIKESLPTETTLVAVIENQVVGFGAIVEASNELRAVYVHSEFGGMGVGAALLFGLEKLAKELGCKELKMDSSLTAAPFYAHHGYEEIERGFHNLRSGKIMACVKMRKAII